MIPCGIFFLRGADGGFYVVYVFEECTEFLVAGRDEQGTQHPVLHFYVYGKLALYFVERKKDEGRDVLIK